MGMESFYVTVFVIFFWGGDGAAIGRFAVFFKGVLRNIAFLCGVFVVNLWWVAW
jgi:hypothetical protein